MNREQMIAHLVILGWEPMSSGVWFGMFNSDKGALTYYKPETSLACGTAWEVTCSPNFDSRTRRDLYNNIEKFSMVGSRPFDWADIDDRMIQPLFDKAATL